MVFTVWVYAAVTPFTEGWEQAAIPLASRDFRLHSLRGLLWGAVAVAFPAVSTAACAVLVYVIARSLGERRHRRPSLLGTLMAALVTSAAIYMSYCLDSPFGEDRIATTRLVARTLGDVARRVDILWVVTLVCAVLIVIASCACLFEADRTSKPDADLEARAVELRERYRRLNLVLMAGAGVLVAGVLQVELLYGWATAMADLAQYGNDAAKQIASAATDPGGVFFSIFLAATYGPSVAVLRIRAADLARQAVDAPAKIKVAEAEGKGQESLGSTPEEQWLEKRGLVFSPGQKLKSVMAILGPLLASGSLLTALTALG